jgi:alkylation response protein AidB-like acyl-CoA dehydrogenase
MSVGPCEEAQPEEKRPSIFSYPPTQKRCGEQSSGFASAFRTIIGLRDRDGGFPHEFHAMLAADDWLGIAMPEAYGGGGLGITEAAIMMQAIAESGAETAEILLRKRTRNTRR